MLYSGISLFSETYTDIMEERRVDSTLHNYQRNFMLTILLETKYQHRRSYGFGNGVIEVEQVSIPFLRILFGGMYLIFLGLGIYLFILVAKFLKRGIKALDIYINNNRDKAE